MDTALIAMLDALRFELRASALQLTALATRSQGMLPDDEWAKTKEAIKALKVVADERAQEAWDDTQKGTKR